MGTLKKILKKVINPLTPINVVGKAADWVEDKTGLGDSLSDTKLGKVINYALNPVAQSQAVRDTSEPVKEWAESNPDKVKLIGNVVQVIGAGVALVFPPAGAVVSAVGTGIVYASKAIGVKEVITSIPNMFKGVQQAIKEKNWSLALLTLSYLCTQGENITSYLRETRIGITNDGQLTKYENTLDQLAQLTGNSAATITKANEVYSSLLTAFENNSGENQVIKQEIKQTDTGEYIAVEIAENSPFLIRFLKWFFGV